MCVVNELELFRVHLNILYIKLVFLAISGAQFKIKLHAHAPVHINWLKNQICVLGCMLRSHGRNGNEFFGVHLAFLYIN